MWLQLAAKRRLEGGSKPYPQCGRLVRQLHRMEPFEKIALTMRISCWLRKRTSTRTVLPREEAWMRSQGWRACCVPALFRTPQQGEWVSNKQTAGS